jgi:hypothetical protein
MSQANFISKMLNRNDENIVLKKNFIAKKEFKGLAVKFFMES